MMSTATHTLGIKKIIKRRYKEQFNTESSLRLPRTKKGENVEKQVIT